MRKAKPHMGLLKRKMLVGGVVDDAMELLLGKIPALALRGRGGNTPRRLA